jgi:hypothetical protein
MGEQHGDIRNDHILIDSDTGRYRWIDFDYTVNYLDYDIWGLGNILTYAVGKGIHTCRGLEAGTTHRRDSGIEIVPDDALLFYRYRLANLRKLFPYIPAELNDILMRFSAAATNVYEDFSSLVRDLRLYLD